MAKKQVQISRVDTMENEEPSMKSIMFEDTKPIENFTMGSHPNSKNLHSVGHLSQGTRKSTLASLFKVVLLGDTKVGKSSIVMRLVVNILVENTYRMMNSHWSIIRRSLLIL